MTIIELLLHSINFQVFMTKVMQIADVGGTYIDHMFGAYFGLAVAYMLGKPSGEPEFGNIHDILSLIGTVFLWIYWPSFVVGAAPADSIQQERGFVNTIICLASSTVVTFWATLILSKNKKFRPVDIQNATLAGGVAIGCTANLSLSAFGACMIGAAAGIVSCVGYNIVQPFLEQRCNLHDTCGVHYLHAMPSVVGALASVIIAAYKQSDGRYQDADIYGDVNHGNQWWRQLVAIIFCIGFAVSSGLIVGMLLKYISPSISKKEFHDIVWWEVAGDYNKSLYSELAMIVEPGLGLGSGKSDYASGIAMQAVSDFSSHNGRRTKREAPAADNEKHVDVNNNIV